MTISIVDSSAADYVIGSGAPWEGGAVGQWAWRIPAQYVLAPVGDSQWEEIVGGELSILPAWPGIV